MKQTPRTRKINETAREALASILHEEIADPRLELVTITGVNVAPDLTTANVYVTAHGDEERYREVLDGLESAKGRIRSLFGAAVKMRFTPELRFFIDESVDAGMRMAEALKDVPPTLAAKALTVSDDDVSDADTGPHADAASPDA
ncbi:MAG: 30S ribosome-binding factor RbfA [Actinomycetota bacterium]|nr:30S ribosome-binding factor RbfA [Actinomycetota bacterium]MDZ4181198.1 30S ribosome-binding factor RbfA [Coriobacteriia bacterium]